MIDDDEELGEILRPVLERYGIDLRIAFTPSEGFKQLEDEIPDVLLLDMMLPEMDGMAVCRQIRGSSSPYQKIPIVALSARSELTDRVVGLESGIDDYIAKPFETRELVARLGAVIRRKRHMSDTPDTVANIQAPRKGLILAASRLEAFYDGYKATLTDLEMQIISQLKLAEGKVLSRTEIFDRIGHSQESDPAMIDTIIYRVRQKFRDAGLNIDFIHTVRGQGYRIAAGTTI